MKKIFALFVVVFFTATVLAQSPEKMSYQAVIRNSSNDLVSSSTVGMQISILQGSATGTPVYVETQTPTSNINGLVTIEIGGGTIVTGTFADIGWSAGTFFIKTETDPAGGTNYTITGISQILSVPYALYAKTAKSLTGGITGWSLLGNNGTDAATNFIGTTDPVDFVVKTNNTEKIRITSGGNIGIGTTNPLNKLQIQNGNMVIDRSISTSILSLGTVAGVTGRIFAGDAGGGSLNTNYNQIKMTANPANTEELLRLHTGADAMSNTGTAALYFGQFNLMDMAAIKAVNEGGQPLNRTAGLSFWTEPAGTGVPLQERMRITGNGNVGIGTTSPTNKLSVAGIADVATSVQSPLLTPLPGVSNTLTIQTNDGSASTGSMTIRTGDVSANGPVSGSLTLRGGNFTGGYKGAQLLLQGYPGSNGGGSATLSGGDGWSDSGGDVTIQGSNKGWGNGGNIYINGGNGGAGAGGAGHIILTTGNDASSGPGMIMMKISGTEAVRVNTNGNVGIGTASPQGALDVNSTTGAFIVPRMTTVQRDALTAVNGMIIYNTTNNQFNFYENSAWVLK